ALKTWQCASMMRSTRGATGCTQADAGNAALPAANAMPPATNSRRRISRLIWMLPKAIWHCRIVQVYRGREEPRAKKPDTHTGAHESIRLFFDHGVAAAAPGAVEFFQELFGRRDTARDIFLNRAQIACLVLAAIIQPSTPRKSLLRQSNRRLSEVQHVVPCDPSGET